MYSTSDKLTALTGLTFSDTSKPTYDQVGGFLAQIDAETCDEQGEYIWPKIMPTVRYNCAHCAKDWPTDSKFRHDQSQRGKYISTNPNAPEDHRSFHMEATSIYYEGFSLAETLKLKLTAVQAYKRGAIEPFKNYMQKQRAMAWDDSPSMVDEKASYDRSKGEYLLREHHEDEISRFLCVDNQAGKASQGAHRWVTCRSFGPMECRLIEAKMVTTWEQVEELRIELGVEPARTLVDVAFDTAAVQAVCVKYGWQGLWGDATAKDSFPHHENVMTPTGPARVTRRLPFSPVQIGHKGIGKSGQRMQARYFWWCQKPIKDMWHRLKNGLTSYRWTVAQNTPEEHRKQTNVEFKKQQTDKKTGKKTWHWCIPSGADNHLTDTDQMCLVAAIMDKNLQPILWTVTEMQQPTENES